MSDNLSEAQLLQQFQEAVEQTNRIDRETDKLMVVAAGLFWLLGGMIMIANREFWYWGVCLWVGGSLLAMPVLIKRLGLGGLPCRYLGI